MKKLTIIFPYYKNAGMLKRQVEEWLTYPHSLIDDFEIIVVDDGSPKGFGLREAVLESKPWFSNIQVRLFRILTDLRWNISQARNIGALKAESMWLLFSDIDHLLPAEMIAGVLDKINRDELDSGTIYRFNRVWNQSNEPARPHLETTLMRKSLYWKIGGHDESFSGHYSIADEEFRSRFEKLAAIATLNFAARLVGRDEIQDASTDRAMGCKESIEGTEKENILAWKAEQRRGIETLKLPWKEIKL